MQKQEAGFETRDIVYFDRMGPVNTEMTLKLARKRFDELELSHVLLATSFGDTAVKALDYFEGSQLCIISSMYGYREPGKCSIRDEHREKLEAAGATIVHQTHVFAGLDRSINRKYGGLTPIQLIGQAFKMLGEGFKVCTEIAVMAADSGQVPIDREVLTIAGTGRGADTAIVLVPAHSNDFFKLHFREIICMPR